jgi:hypothetical protein
MSTKYLGVYVAIIFVLGWAASPLCFPAEATADVAKRRAFGLNRNTPRTTLSTEPPTNALLPEGILASPIFKDAQAGPAHSRIPAECITIVHVHSDINLTDWPLRDFEDYPVRACTLVMFPCF